MSFIVLSNSTRVILPLRTRLEAPSRTPRLWGLLVSQAKASGHCQQSFIELGEPGLPRPFLGETWRHEWRTDGDNLLAGNPLTEIWRHPLHTREFGSQVTNVLRCLQLEAHGYQVNVTELVGWEHSMKNELIIASYKDLPRRRPTERLQEVLQTLGLEEMSSRFFTPA